MEIMRKIIDLKGQQFGRLIVLEYSHTDKRGYAMWKCQCNCGNETTVCGRSLRTGHTISCGCLHKERMDIARKSHSKSKTHIYQTWSDMKQRCFNNKNKAFKYYGDRGITVCDEWKDSFEAFYDYVSQLPHFGEAGYSLDRINNDGNYEPNNVRWATLSEQNKNKRKRGKKDGTESQ